VKRHVFGKSIEYYFTPQADGEPIEVNSLVASRIYTDQPTQAQIEDTASGHVEEVTAWTSEGKGTYKITFAALTDSDEHSSTAYETYYIVVNFKYQSGGATKFSVEPIFVYRPDAFTSNVTTSWHEVVALEAKIEDLMTQTEINRLLATAERRIYRKIRAQGGEKRKLFNFEELNDAVLYLTTAYCCRNLAGEGNQFWMEKYRDYLAEAEAVFAATEPGYDADDDGAEVGETLGASGMVYVFR